MAKEKQEKARRADRLIGRRYRYTKDYQVLPGLGPKGSREKRVIYTGEWILPANDGESYQKLVKALRLLTALAVLAVLGALAILPPPMENKWYLPVLTVSLFPLAYQIMGAVSLPSQKTHMERQRYDKSVVRVGHSAMFAFVVMCLAALGLLVYWIVAASGGLGSPAYTGRDAAFALLLVLAAAAELLSWKLYGRIQPETVPNERFSG